MLDPTSLLRELNGLQIPAYPSVTGLPIPITIRSLGTFVLALGWGILLLFSFVGWGRCAARLVRVKFLPTSIACAIGIATLIFLGSLLNLLHAIYSPVLIVFVAIGWVFYLIFRSERSQLYGWKRLWTQTSIWSRVFIVAMLIVLTFRVAGTVRLGEFNVSDDSAAYLALAKKTLSSHHLAIDPFSERRNTSSLGGAYFLQDLVLSATSLSNISMADRTLGLLLLVAVTFDLGTAFELSAVQISLLELLIVLVPQETFNLTFIVLPVPLLLVIMWLVFQAQSQEGEGWFGYAFLAGVVGGAAISLKSTYLPIVAALSTIPYLFSVISQRPKRTLNLLLGTAAGIVLVLIFWMIAMKLDSGSYLFPVLGRGIDYSAYKLFHPATRFPTRRSLIKIFLQGAVLLFLAGVQMLPRPWAKLSLFSVSILVSAALAVIAFNYTSGADYIWRYNFPQAFSAVIFFCAASLAIGNSKQQSQLFRLVGYAGIAALVSMIFYYDIAGKKPRPFHTELAEATNRESLYAGLSGRSLTTPRLKAEYLQLERSIPENGKVLENVAYSFLLNYRSHSIYIMDWPGASAPSPGWPFGTRPVQFADYLQKNSIRYVVLDHRYMRQNDAEMCQDLGKPGSFSVLLRQHLWLNILADHQLNQIMARYQVIYDDGSIGVVDLTRPVPGNLSSSSSWNVDTNVGAVCSGIAENYFAIHSEME